jgi:pimeloyl-ACP methyl ester carboxylesterase
MSRLQLMQSGRSKVPTQGKRNRRKVQAGVLLTITALLLIITAVAWVPDRPVDELKARWAPPPSEFLPLQGMEVHLRDEGWLDDPQPILLLHGTFASLHSWDGWVAALTPRRRVIRVDLPAFGLTGPFPHDDYHIARYIHFIEELLDSLGIQRAIIGGNSFGGQLAWETAATLPERVDALILVGAVGYPLHADEVPLGIRIAGSGWLQALMNHLLPRGVVESSLRSAYGDPERVTADLVDRNFELTLREGNRRARSLRFEHALPSAARAARIATLTQPTLILWGERDRLIPPAIALRFSGDIDDSRVVMFEALGHMPHEEAPEVTVSVVLEFLEDLQQLPGALDARERSDTSPDVPVELGEFRG